MEKPVYVIGHRNPDTDSICSAIGYAYLKTQLGLNCIPARAGRINSETEYALKYFNVPEPVLVHDLYPQVDDLKLAHPPVLSKHDTLRDAGSLFVEKKELKTLPIVDEEKNILGVLTAGDLARHYYKEMSLENMETGKITYNGILRALEGELLCGNADKEFTGQVRIGALLAETLREVTQPGNLLIVGNRVEAQKAALQAGAVSLVLTCGSELTDEVKCLAEERKAVVIRTSYDTYTTGRLIGQSVEVKNLMTEDPLCFKTTDLLSDVKATMAATDYESYPVLESGKYVGMLERGLLIEPQRQQVILVDHNERSQAVEGIEEAEILEIIDHHRLGGLTTSSPIFIRQEPVGCTATIVATLAWHRNVALPPSIAGLLFAAICSDTLYFRSPTSTNFDHETAKRLATMAGIKDPDSLALDILKHGSSLANLKAEEIVRSDVKEFEIDGNKFTVGQINIMDREQAFSRLSEITAALEAFRNQEKNDAALLMLTDIMTEATDLVATGKAGILAQVKRAFGSAAPNGVYHLPGVLSRKKQVIPPLSDAIKTSNINV